MMELELRRLSPFGEQLVGELHVNGLYECLTLERAGMEIPPGRFPVTLFMSPKFGRRVPRLADVPDRSDIEMHIGNFPRDTTGCILVGTYILPGGIGGSGWALGNLVKLIAAALARQEDVWLTIKPAALNPAT